MADFRTALAYEKKTYQILAKTAGPEDARTKESEHWLKELTQAAVSMAKREKLAPQSDKGTKKAPAVVKSAPVKTAESKHGSVRFCGLLSVYRIATDGALAD
jgi:hypothetical protein